MRAARIALVIVIGVLLAHSRGYAQVAPGFWRGSGSTDKISDLKWIKLLVHYDSEFSLTANAAGNVDGTATVRYTLRVDDTQLRTLLTNFSGLADSQIGATQLPSAGTIGSLMGLNTRFHELKSIEGSFSGGTVVRQGRIRGRLSGNELHLEWAAPPAAIPYTMYKVYALRREPFKTETAPAYSPWIVDATVSQPAAGHWEASVPASSSVKKSATSVWTVSWSAHQEPAAK